MECKRLNYLDNMKWITVLIVLVYHVIYLFNSSGVISNIAVKGIPIMDIFLVFVYPWFMCLLFIVSGVSIKYSLEKRTSKEFIKDRAKRILAPSMLGIFVYGWTVGLVTNQYADMFEGNGESIPRIIKYLIYCMSGSGPLWFCHVLFIGALLIALMRKIDSKNKIGEVCSKINVPILFSLVLLVWGSSYVLNAPVIIVYRFGIYLLMMLIGYYIFSNQEIIKKLENNSICLGILMVAMGILYVMKYYGQNYTGDAVLTNLFTNTYLWISVIAIFGLSSKYLGFKNKFCEYMTKNNFNIYILHYPIMVVLAYLITTYLTLPFILNYMIILIGTLVLVPLLIEIIKRIPVIRFMVFRN